MGFPKNTTQIVQLIENYPLESYSELAKKANISIQTFIRRVEELRSTGIIGKIHSSLNPESLQLERHLVIFKTSTIKEIKSLELACDKHPYTSSRNRIFGTDYGLYAVFDIPENSKKNLDIFLDYLAKNNLCKSYETYKSIGKRIFHPQPFYNNIIDLDDFDIEDYFKQNKQCKKAMSKGRESEGKESEGRESEGKESEGRESEGRESEGRESEGRESEGREHPFSYIEFHPIQLLILRDITRDFKTPMTELLEKYRSYFSEKTEKSGVIPKYDDVSSFKLPNYFKSYLHEFFSDKRTENAIYLDFKKKYHLVVDKHVESYWLSIKRKYFDLFIRFGYIINNITVEEKQRIFNIFCCEKPPFNIYLEDLGKNIFLTLSLPPYYQSRLSYLMKELYGKFSVFLIDSFEYNAIKYRFFIENYNIENQKWRSDKEWMYDKVVEGIEDNLSKEVYRTVQN